MGLAASAADVHCCRTDAAVSRWPVETELDTAPPKSDGGRHQDVLVYASSSPRIPEPGSLDDQRLFEPPPEGGEEWACCQAPHEVGERVAGDQQDLEAVSYMPYHFDNDETMDVDRSHARYSKIMVYSAKLRPARKKVWEDWLRASASGRPIIVLQGICQAQAEVAPTERVPAVYYVDRMGTRISVLGIQGSEMLPIGILVESLQVICSATEFPQFLEQVTNLLNDDEKSRAILLQYVAENVQRQRLCFLEETVAAKDRFVHALTALWLDRRNDQWY